MGIGKSGLPLWLAGVAVLCTVLACSGETTAPRQNLTPLIPLSVGTTFSYHSIDTLSGTAGDQLAADSDFTVRVVSDIADQSGTRWAALDAPQRVFGSTASASSFFANTPDGLRSVSNNFPGGRVGVSYLVFPYPATPGAFGQFGAVVSATDTVITVPAGTFHCVRYDSSQPAGTPINWSVFIAPGVGVVQRIVSIVTYYGILQPQVLGLHDRIYRLTAVVTP